MLIDISKFKPVELKKNIKKDCPHCRKRARRKIGGCTFPVYCCDDEGCAAKAMKMAKSFNQHYSS